MEKAYQIIDNPRIMTKSEIEKEYRGYWVFMVHAEHVQGQGVIRGMPVVIGEKLGAGMEEGIYEKYKDEKYGMRADADLRLNPSLEELISKSKGA